MAQDFGRLLLRLAVGGLLLLHGLYKLRHGVGFVSEQVAAHGLPAATAYLVYVGEVIAPIFVLLGFMTRPAAVVMAINMATAVWLSHSHQLWGLTKSGGYSLELQTLFFCGALAIACLGTGRYAVLRGAGRWS